MPISIAIYQANGSRSPRHRFPEEEADKEARRKMRSNRGNNVAKSCANCMDGRTSDGGDTRAGVAGKRAEGGKIPQPVIRSLIRYCGSYGTFPRSPEIYSRGLRMNATSARVHCTGPRIKRNLSWIMFNSEWKEGGDVCFRLCFGGAIGGRTRDLSIVRIDRGGRCSVIGALFAKYLSGYGDPLDTMIGGLDTIEIAAPVPYVGSLAVPPLNMEKSRQIIIRRVRSGLRENFVVM
ncbi:hypothetical protein X777_08986 [Ooceraea biroi]|uniref:Uncharacterized protein n=1 Tax=Ooceraea biroi TaxID=2015173 RepID=A0A026W9G1_OOCBI|nr:hypothetical protein X777_08986 [Ooceraea biroi]